MKDATLLEVSYEVANKVGGIYTVLVSKMSYALENFATYYAIGPYYAGQAAKEFTKEKPPANLAAVFAKLEGRGVKCVYGRWKIEGSPKAILVDPESLRSGADGIKLKLWEEYKIDSWKADEWFNEPVVWAKAVGMLIEEMENSGLFVSGAIAHFHEWLTGTALLHLKSAKSKIPTVFTTHSTVLGRAIAETGREDLYEIINKGKVKPDVKAYEYSAQSKHLLEKAAAVNADVFTTVSETTAKECEFVLGRRPDAVLANGLDMRKFPSPENVEKMRKACADRVKTFLLGYFLPSYEIDADNSLVCFISGRHEFRNKGIDIFIDALGRLNARMKKDGEKKTVFAFIWVPTQTKGKKPTVVEHLAVMDDAEKLIDMEAEKIEDEVLRDFIKGKKPKDSVKLDHAFLKRLSGMWETLKKAGGENPPLSPFNVGEDNIIVKSLEKNGLLNRKADRVKVIYYPDYVSESDGLLGLKYYSAMAGCEMGIFPSYYESWGYTPLESAALGLHAVTTDLSGFGKFIMPFLKPGEKSIMVIGRDGKKDADAAKELEELMHDICAMTPEERLSHRMRAKELSGLADWSQLFDNYMKAYEMALRISQPSA
ncbi:MAG: glycogen/starch synthase [Candidatus Aenigmatarchaeota archaeon]